MVASRKNPGELPDPVALVKQAIDADLDPTVFTSRTFPVAKNSIDFCMSHKFLGASDPLWPRQIQMVARFFEDVCYFCSDVDYVYKTPVDASTQDVYDRFCLLEHGVCPRCRRNRLEMLAEWQKDSRYANYHVWDPNVKLRGVPPNEFNGIWGQRSGKSFAVASFFWTYILHRFLALPDITSYFRLASNTVLEAAFVAPTLRQANDYMWTPFTNVFDDSPWFREYVQHLKDEEKKLGISMYHRQQTFMTFPTKRLVVHMKAANSGTLRGGTRVFATCLAGDTLVNTTDGLIPVERDLTGKSVWVNGEAHTITGHRETGRKAVQRTELEYGYRITTTTDHRIRVLTPDLDVVWREAGELKTGDFVAVGLGTEFPQELRLDYSPERKVHRQLEAHMLMADLGTFTSAQIFERTGLKGVYVLTHRLIKRGMLRKTYVKGQGKNAGCVYETTDAFDLDLIVEEHKNHKFKNRDECTFPDVMTPELGYLLGYYVSEGSYAEGATEFSFANTDEQVVQHFVQCFESVFGFSPRVSSWQSKGGGVVKKPTGRTTYNVVVAYKVVKQFLRYLGLEPSTAPTKTVPWSILQAPREAVLAFLSAFIEGDGSISDKYVRLFSSSRDLVHQLQLLLLNLGIVGKIERQRRQDPYHDMWYLRLNRYASVQLAAQLTCVTKGKLFNYEIGKKRNDVFQIPFVPPFVDTSLHGGSIKKYVYVTMELNMDAYQNYAIDQLSYENPELYAKAVPLIDAGMVWFPVVKIEPLGSQTVYDVSIDSEEHALSGDGVIVHNCDELGWFNTDENGKKRAGVTDGTEVFTALNRSLRTVRTRANKRRKQLGDYDTMDAYMFCISSPSSVSDPIEQRAAIAGKSPRMFHSRLPTWEVNPEEDEETIFEEEGADPVKFKRDYCAQPPRAASPFIEASPMLKELVDEAQTKRPLFTYEIRSEVEKATGVTLLRPTLLRKSPDKTTPRVLAVDNGEKKNSFAICVASFYPEHEGVLLEEFLEVAPFQHHQVDLQWCYDELILGLVKAFNIHQVVYDRWESSYAVRDLRSNYKVDADRYSLAWKDFKQFREDLRGSRVWFPVPEIDPEELLQTNNLVERARHPRAHFQLQLTTVNEFNRRVEKPELGNDDLFRCAVLAHWAVMNNKDAYRRGMRRRGSSRPAPIMAFPNRRGRGGRRGGGRGGGMAGFGFR